ncbi:hypothetical protein L4G92_07860 [Neisseria sp. ZJ106]|uniref:Phage associated protein n=1 Tax=Neisseria lisongii TaxID=2912188 RepID=A0ABY7RJ66_9NEIS|nr:hypothetical protein [Neisseria lisongii]MCF7521958.1 hypothetical protein [Neisseria lisongii]WCL71332.1 hypothetical protein PJU73_08350 [Neisseria lisongii]WCL72326.1 hypothetical protein PJU73_04300 [Neisseria lisongii]
MSEPQKKQGFFVVAAFDRMIVRERKNEDGSYTKTHYVGLIVRTEEGTRLCQVRTKQPEKYSHYKLNDIVNMEVFPRAFKDNIYYSDET